MAKKSPKQKIFIAKESTFSATKNGEIRFCVGYFTYKIRGIKCMHVHFINNVCAKITNIGLKGLNYCNNHSLHLSGSPSVASSLVPCHLSFL